MRIAVLGGSFDPIHHGHLILATVAREALGADRVVLVPAGQQPFKVGQHGASAVHRARMAEVAIAGTDGFQVDRVEVDRPGPSYTVDTLADLLARHSGAGAELTLLLGADAAELFWQWRDPAGIKARAAVAVFARSGETPPPGVADRVIEIPRIDVSSTLLRERIRQRRSIRYFMPDSVIAYIAEHGLYRD